MIFGDLLAVGIERRFDVVLCMDVLEHISPLKLDHDIRRLFSLIDEDGYLYVNVPVWSKDRVFGVLEEPILKRLAGSRPPRVGEPRVVGAKIA